MSEHLFTREGGGVEQVRSVCTCGEASPLRPNHWQAEDWESLHLREVQRRLASADRMPSLKSSAAYYRKMADNLDAPVSERELWNALAKELEDRLNANADPGDQPTLF